jgi:serine/threonine protein kinase
MIANQALSRIEDLHLNHFLHRDIKPGNFVVGATQRDKIFMIDMGLSGPFRDPFTKEHIARREGRKLTGTPRFASLNVHQGIRT